MANNQLCKKYKEMPKVRSFSCVREMIKDLKRHGPASIIHLIILSTKIERPIYVWNNDGTLNAIVGKDKTGIPIDVEYHASDSGQIGHWTLKYGKDPTNISLNLNSCLFSVIGSQIGQNPLTLRRWTLVKLMNNFQHLDSKMTEILKLGKNTRISLLIGGARYVGTSVEDAKKLLDYAEDNYFHPLFSNGWYDNGHPRGHAYLAEDEKEEILQGKEITQVRTVLCHSWQGQKTAFLSRRDQDHFAHLALKSSRANKAMCDLNTYCQREPSEEIQWSPCTQSAHVSIDELQTISKQLNIELKQPKCQEWLKGKLLIPELNFSKVVLILRHQLNKTNDPEADVFVHSFYPKDYVPTKEKVEEVKEGEEEKKKKEGKEESTKSG